MSMLSNIPNPVKWIVGAGIVIALGLMIWFGVLTRAWNGIGNLLFHHQANEMSQDVKDQLAKAAEQKERYSIRRCRVGKVEGRPRKGHTGPRRRGENIQ